MVKPRRTRYDYKISSSRRTAAGGTVLLTKAEVRKLKGIKNIKIKK